MAGSVCIPTSSASRPSERVWEMALTVGADVRRLDLQGILANGIAS